MCCHIELASLERTVPFCLHADGAEMFTNEEYFCWSWSSAFVAASAASDILMTRYPIAIVAEREMTDCGTAALARDFCQPLSIQTERNACACDWQWVKKIKKNKLVKRKKTKPVVPRLGFSPFDP